MPAAVAAVAGAVAGKAVASYVVGSVMLSATASAIVGAVVSTATSMVVSSLVGDAMGAGGSSQAAQSSPAALADQGQLVNTAGTVDAIPVIYGTRRIGGTRILIETAGSNNTDLHIVLAHCEGEIDAISAVYFDNTICTDARFSGLYTVQHALGTDAQAANASLMAALPSKWTSAHKLSGVAYTYAKLTFNRDKWGGLPTISVDIRGRKVYDPRTGLTAWSDNPALCLRDYLTNTRFGRGIAAAEIDDAAIIAAANYCDELVTTPSGTVKRYTCNGIINTERNSIENVRLMLTAMRGMLIFTGGQYRLVLDRDEVGSFTFTEDHIVGAWNIKLADKRRLFNRVRAEWINPDKEWQPDLSIIDSTTYRSADNGLLLEAQISLPFTTDHYQAQLLAQRHLKQSRFGIVASFRATIAGLRCECGDVVAITHSTPGWSSKLFRIVRIALLNSDEVEITATEYDDSVYSADPLTTPRVSVATSLPDPYTVAAPGSVVVSESLYETREGAGVRAKATLTWLPADDAFVASYHVEGRLVGGDWYVLADTPYTTVDVLDIAPGQYDLRVRAVNSLGVASDWSTTTRAEILGLTARPADITGLKLQTVGGLVILSWDLPGDLDVRMGGRVLIRHIDLSSAGATWENSLSIGDPRGVTGSMTVAVLPLKPGTYLVKAEDSTGNQSLTAAEIETADSTAITWSPLASVQEDATFTGTHSSTFNDAGVLTLAGASLIDAEADFDAIPSIDYAGGVAASGTYTFAAGIDLGLVKRCQIIGTLSATTANVFDLVDSRVTDIDAWQDFDGPLGGGLCDAVLEVRSTPDNPAGSPTWSAWGRCDVTEFNARGFQFRAVLTSTDAAYTIRVDQLRAAARAI